MTIINSEVLKNVELFKALSEENQEILCPYFEVAEFQKSDFLFEQGNTRVNLFVILEGEINLVDLSLGVKKKYSTVGPGTVLGEPLLVEKDVHSLGGEANTDGIVAKLSETAIQQIKQENLPLYTELLIESNKVLARRMANASRGDRGRGELYRSGQTRKEHDLLGEKSVPRQALWGIHTLRALDNFNITGIHLDHFPEFVESLAIVKRACATVNHDLGNLEQDISNAIIEACDEIQRGLWHGHFVVDVIQGGAGTSTNMNANEVIANRALEILGHQRGDYQKVHPNNHVNMSQSTNDVYPSTIKISLLLMINDFLQEADLLADAFNAKAEEFDHIIKMGRTQLQDAVPMTLGQEFGTWEKTIKDSKMSNKVEVSVSISKSAFDGKYYGYVRINGVPECDYTYSADTQYGANKIAEALQAGIQVVESNK